MHMQTATTKISLCSYNEPQRQTTAVDMFAKRRLRSACTFASSAHADKKIRSSSRSHAKFVQHTDNVAAN